MPSAGKIARALDEHRDRRVDDAVLVKVTGLTVEQIHAGIAWHNQRAAGFHGRTGD